MTESSESRLRVTVLADGDCPNCGKRFKFEVYAE